MRRRKKDKPTTTKPSSYAAAAAIGTEDADILLQNGPMTHDTALVSRGRVSGSKQNAVVADHNSSTGGSKIALLAMTKSRSPPQQRRRGGLLGLGGSVRDLVEQVQDSLTKSKQDTSSTAGGDSSSLEKPRSFSSKHSKSASPSAPSSTHSTPGSPTSATAGTSSGGPIVLKSSPAPSRKKVLDLKLLSSGTSLTLRMKKPAAFTPSPSEFKPRARPDAADQPFCQVCATPFTIMVRRQRCQVCGESVCAQCSSDKRHVEGHKGLQRVCDICIVEGPVVLDENGMYAVGPSPVATPMPLPIDRPVSLPAPAPAVTVPAPPVPITAPKTVITRSAPNQQRPQEKKKTPPAPRAPTDSRPVGPAVSSAVTSSQSSSRSIAAASGGSVSRDESGGDGRGVKTSTARTLFADSPAVDKPKPSSVQSSGTSRAGRGQTGDTGKDANATGNEDDDGGWQTPRTPKNANRFISNNSSGSLSAGSSVARVLSGAGNSPAAAAAVIVPKMAAAPDPAPVPSLPANPELRGERVGSSGDGSKATPAAVKSEAEKDKEAEASAAAAAAWAAMADDDDDDQETGAPPVIAPARTRRRSRKARKAAGVTEAKPAAADHKTSTWSGQTQTFAEFLGLRGNNSSTNSAITTGNTVNGVNTPSNTATVEGRGSTGGGSVPASSRSARFAAPDQRGFSNHDNPRAGNIGGPPTGPGGGDLSHAGNNTIGSNSATRKWESTGKKRSSGAGTGAKNGPRQAVGQGSGFVRDFIRGAGIHRLDPRRLAGPIITCTTWTGADRLWSTAWTLVGKLFDGSRQSLPHGGRSSNQGRNAGGSGARSRGGHNNSNHCAARGGIRWKPGKRVISLSALVLLASYRRYQVTHPEVTAEHVLGSASSIVFALGCFLTRAVVDLARDACGTVLPSLCGSRAQRLLLVGQRAGGGDAGNGGGGVLEAGGGSVAGGGEDAGEGEGHELDRYFFL